MEVVFKLRCNYNFEKKSHKLQDVFNWKQEHILREKKYINLVDKETATIDSLE